MDGNIFTVQMFDVILPVKTKDDLDTFNHMFIVMKYYERDIYALLG